MEIDSIRAKALPRGPEVNNGTLIDNDVLVTTPGFFSSNVAAAWCRRREWNYDSNAGPGFTEPKLDHPV